MLKRRKENEEGQKKNDAINAMKKLDEYANDLKGAFKDYNENSNLIGLKKKVEEGTRLLGEKIVKPEMYRPLRNLQLIKVQRHLQMLHYMQCKMLRHIIVLLE